MHPIFKQALAGIAPEPEQMTEWQPIETAPKDGSKFLIWTKRCGFSVVEHDPWDPMPTDIVPSGHHLMVDDGKGLHSLRGDYPTHWMPLPPPPSIALVDEAQSKAAGK